MTNKLSIIVAMDNNFAIGKNNDLPWHIPSDLKRFKQLTTNNVILMGRKTFESLKRPLPNRINVVITRNKDYIVPEGVLVFNSVEEAISNFNNEHIFIIGGANIYNQTYDLVDDIYLTNVYTDVIGADTFLSVKMLDNFTLKTQTNHKENDLEFSYSYYEKNK